MTHLGSRSAAQPGRPTLVGDEPSIGRATEPDGSRRNLPQPSYRVLLVALLAGAALVFGGVFLYRHLVPRTAYVNLAQAYHQFTLTKELEAKLNTTKRARQAVLDSLSLQLRQLGARVQGSGARKPDPSELQLLETRAQEYKLKEKQFEEDNQALSEQYTDQVWTQINQYMKNYGKEHRYTYILGAEGSGVLMFADERYDITSEVVAYWNRQYAGSAH